MAQSKPMMSELHVVVGAGQVGMPLAQLLVSRGKRVRLVRHASSGTLDGVEVVRGDLADRDSILAATAGAGVIYHCSNPDYFADLWARLLPLWTESLIASAGATGARLVVLDNVYPFGDLRGAPLNEQSPMRPSSRKGAERARSAERLMQAHRAGEAKVVVGRASDFYGPGGTKTYFGDQFWPSVLAGKRAITLGNWDTPHTYHYLPDVVAAMVDLGSADEDVLGQWWMLPCRPPVTTRELGSRLAAAAGRTLRTRQLPLALFPLVGLFIKEMPELREMLYQWDGPFVMDDRRFRARFPDFTLADSDEALRATAAWAQAHYAKSRRAG